MLLRGQSCIAGMKRQMNNEKIQLVTGVLAIFVLPNTSCMYRASLDILSINAENLKCYKLVYIGKMVVCCDSFGNCISASEESVILCLDQW